MFDSVSSEEIVCNRFAGTSHWILPIIESDSLLTSNLRIAQNKIT